MEKTVNIKIPLKLERFINEVFVKNTLFWVIVFLTIISFFFFQHYYQNSLSLSYNDARSHLNIGRRVVEGLKPGLAQIGSVWLPLNHMLMVPLVWSDFMWHSGLAGAFWSMISFILCGVLIYKFLEKLNVSVFGRIVAVLVYVGNLNVLYLQSTAMTENILLATMMAGVYYLMTWAKDQKLFDLVKSSFWIMASTLVRYDGWFLLVFSAMLITFYEFKNKGYKKAEGSLILFMTLGALGIGLWVLWNLLIFNDPLYFIFGPFSAHAQQLQLESAGQLATKGNLLLSTKVYLLALFYNSYTLPVILAFFGSLLLFLDKKISAKVKIMSISLFAPLIFNVLALTLGFSVLFIQGIDGNSWFNVRYGIMMVPAISIFIGYLIHKANSLKWAIAGILFMVSFFAFANSDAVTIEDAMYGSSGKNVKEVAGWVEENASKEGFVLISAASHDAIIFSSNLPMKKFIHEGTGLYWDDAIKNPSKLARFIIARTNDNNDLAWREMNKDDIYKYELKETFPFADIYELKEEFLEGLITAPIYPNQK